jgi:hypothetical protein
MFVLAPCTTLGVVRRSRPKEAEVLGRTGVAALALSVLASPAAAFAATGETSEVTLRREDDAAEVVVAQDDDRDRLDGTGDSRSGYTSGVNSRDATGSRHTAVSRDRDRSRGDKTRDWTKDGKGGLKRDWSGGHTNDRSRNDTR